jgi:hypothetical protein
VKFSGNYYRTQLFQIPPALLSLAWEAFPDRGNYDISSNCPFRFYSITSKDTVPQGGVFSESVCRSLARNLDNHVAMCHDLDPTELDTSIDIRHAAPPLTLRNTTKRSIKPTMSQEVAFGPSPFTITSRGLPIIPSQRNKLTFLPRRHLLQA